MFNKSICSSLTSFWRWEGIFIFISIFFFFFNAAFVPFSFLCCEFPVTVMSLPWLVVKGARGAEDPPPGEHALLAPCKQRGAGGGRWWRCSRSSWGGSIPAGTAGPPESVRFSRSPVAQLPIVCFLIHLGIWVPEKVVKTNGASCYL